VVTSLERRAFDAYVPRGVLKHLAIEPFTPVRSVEGTMLFADLSGFTRLSERLARRGPEGAELLVGTINQVFESLLRVAYDNGGSLIKFGGDALLLFFEGDQHPLRAARAAFRMRDRLRVVGRLEVAGVRGTLRMTIGVHTDTYHFFLVGESHLEHLVLGPGAGGIVRTEAVAENGQIVLSATTAALLPARVRGGPAGDGVLLRGDPLTRDLALAEPLSRPATELVARTLSTAVRAHISDGGSVPEHRRACVAFLHFAGTDAIIADEGLDAAAAAVAELVTDVQRAADQWEICFLDSDVDANGGKLLLTAGAPRVVGDDEERMLLALRQILDGQRRLPIRIGVNRGPTFTGEIGPAYRRSYIVMGDTTNLAARVMAKANFGELYATAGILERSTTKFATTALEPFVAKGKSRPVQAWSVGVPLRAAAAATEPTGAGAVPFVGRTAELAALIATIRDAAAGRGSLVEVVGEPGVGKTRLVSEAASRTSVLWRIQLNCEAHLSTVPYSLWHGLLRELLGLAWLDAPARVAEVLTAACSDRPGQADWAPLLGDALGVEMPETAASAALLPQYRQQRLHEAVLSLLEPHLAVPTLVEIDSAHVMDEASAALLAALSLRLPDTSWTVVMLRRPGTPRVPAAPTHTVAPTPLSADEARVLAHAATESAPLPPHRIELVVDRAGGNPQFLLDLLAAAGGDLPDSGQAAAMAHLDALPPRERSFVRRAAVLGSTFPPELAEAVLGADAGPATGSGVGGLIVLTPDGHLRFAREVIREAAYAAIPYAERRVLHAAVAEALGAGVAAAVDPGVLARHHRLAGCHERAYPLAREAAERAAAHSAPVAAAGLYRDALESASVIGVGAADLVDLWEGLGDALRLAGETAPADRAYREARRAVAADPVRLAALFHRQARLAQRAGHPTAGVRWARRGARALAGLTGPAVDSWRARLLAAEAADRMDQGQTNRAIRLCRQALELSAEADDEVGRRARAHASYLLDWALVVAGRGNEAVHSAEALRIYDRLGEDEEKAKVLNNLGMFAYWEGRWDDAVRLYRECGELAERTGDVETAACADCNVGEVLADQGHWDAAEVALAAASRVWRASGNTGGAGFVRMLQGRLAARRGHFDEGIALLETAVAQLRSWGMEDAVVAQTYLVEALAYAGDGGRAAELIGKVRPVAGRAAVPLLERCAALARRGDGPAAVVEGLRLALAAALAAGNDFEVATILDLLVGAADPADAEALKAWSAQRDMLFARLGVLRAAASPVQR